MVRNVVSPATSSVRTLVPCSVKPKYRSNHGRLGSRTLLSVIAYAPCPGRIGYRAGAERSCPGTTCPLPLSGWLKSQRLRRTAAAPLPHPPHAVSHWQFVRRG